MVKPGWADKPVNRDSYLGLALRNTDYADYLVTNCLLLHLLGEQYGGYYIDTYVVREA